MAIQDNMNSVFQSGASLGRTIIAYSAVDALKAKASTTKESKKNEAEVAAEKKEKLVNNLAEKAANAEFATSKESKAAGAAFVAGFGSDYNNMLDDADKTTRAGRKSKAANAEKTRNKYIEAYEKSQEELKNWQESKSLQVKKPRKGGSI